MNRLSAFIVTLFLVGCSGKSDVGVFIVQHATQLGARVQQTNGLPQLVAHWSYKEDQNGLRMYIAGDHLNELQSFLTAAFGPEPGVDFSYRLDVGNGGKERVTSLAVARLKR